jgi:hypothetical protein
MVDIPRLCFASSRSRLLNGDRHSPQLAEYKPICPVVHADFDLEIL